MFGGARRTHGHIVNNHIFGSVGQFLENLKTNDAGFLAGPHRRKAKVLEDHTIAAYAGEDWGWGDASLESE